MSVSAGRQILGKSKAVLDLLKMIGRVSSSKTNVLIIGESGTGKELVARMIHDTGPLKHKPFVPVNCGAIPENLIESEMFGHKRGSFTGAVVEKSGLFEAANLGTLFLDEVGELPLNMQVKLLRAIQERVFRKVGGTEDIHVDVRIIAATNRDLEAAVAKSTFREDLYYRLNVLLIRTPPLKERDGDIRILAESFLKKFSEKQGKELHELDPKAIHALETYAWPGNIRELENVIERAVTLAGSGKIGVEALPGMVQDCYRARLLSDSQPKGTAAAGKAKAHQEKTLSGSAAELRLPAPDFSAGPLDIEKIISDAERVYVTAALALAEGQKKKAAELLKLNSRSLRYKMTKLGLGTAEDPE